MFLLSKIIEAIGLLERGCISTKVYVLFFLEHFFCCLMQSRKRDLILPIQSPKEQEIFAEIELGWYTSCFTNLKHHSGYGVLK